MCKTKTLNFKTQRFETKSDTQAALLPFSVVRHCRNHVPILHTRLTFYSASA